MQVGHLRRFLHRAIAHHSIAVLMIILAASLASATPSCADVSVGDVITKANMAEHKELLPPSVQRMLQYGMTIEVDETVSCPWPESYKRATEQYAAQVELTEDRLGLNSYVAGMPFPDVDANDPDAAWKIMWNHEHKPAFSDDVRTEWVIDIQNDVGQTEKLLASNVWRRLKWEGRMNLDPKPVIPHDPPLRYTEQWGPINTPFDLKGTSFLLYRYDVAARSDDSWLYLPQLRRVRRYSTSDRSGTLFGGDIDQDSIWGFNSKPEWWDFRLLGEKEIMVPMHIESYQTADVWCGENGPVAWVPCVKWEKRKVWIIDGRPEKLPVYAFSKRHLWIDQEVFNVTTSEMFDKAEELWKVWQNFFWCTKSARDGREYPDQRLFTPAVAMIDFQLSHSSRIRPPGPGNPLRDDWMFETGEESRNLPDYYTIASIIKEAR